MGPAGLDSRVFGAANHPRRRCNRAELNRSVFPDSRCHREISQMIRRSKALSTSPAQVQLLEQRTLPAGNVAVSLSGEVLSMRGDEADNSVVINQLANGTIEIKGLAGTK